MSTDYDLLCTKCKKHLHTVASASGFYGEKLWRDDAALDLLGAFLFAHAGHPLVFDDTQRLMDAEPEAYPDEEGP